MKSVSIFSKIPEESLVEVASVLEELNVEKGREIFKKGDIGTTMYIVVEGQVCIHDDDKILGNMGVGAVFGELSALDPQPRSASVTATEDTYLFCIDQISLYELMTQYTDVAQGIIRVLCQRVRDCDAALLSVSKPGV
ncbi:MAG: cyclic nucleotide-binding domain-containing protein [Pyrinomonadaceae bacterium MAG19_C2-C3]|nr:cyclic nucleotide-binding domain-containing protein [Pyrinomonadaceae bacterium MAG19_C2-C3]